MNYTVIARNEKQYQHWIMSTGKKLPDCKLVRCVEDCKKISEEGFTNPERELVLLEGWIRGKDTQFAMDCVRVIGLYCRDKGVHEVPTI